MQEKFKTPHIKNLNRRQLLKLGLAGVGLTGASLAWHHSLNSSKTAVRIPSQEPISSSNINAKNFNPMAILRDFDYGTIKHENGRLVREYRVAAKSSVVQLNSAISYVTWNLNGRVPGPTLRATQGDLVRVIFHNEDGHSHSLHFHGVHPEAMDGVQPVRHGKTMVYEFNAEPYGVHLYHCHIAPVTRHISKGLYGMFIVDPPGGRPPADEMVMVMGGYDIDNNEHNDIYALNGLPNFYRDHPIQIYQNQLVRMYVLNMIEFDPAVTFHIHANMFRVFRTGMTLKPSEETDVITMGTAERHILEFAYPYTGTYMFHPHQDSIAEHGCMGNFEVVPA